MDWSEDEDEEKVICKTEVSWSTADNHEYKVEVQLSDYFETSQIKTVYAKLYHCKPSTGVSSSSSPSSNKEIGSLDGSILPRPTGNFHQLGDVISDELQWLTCLFCDHQGRLSRINTNLDGQDIASGGFCHIDKVKVDKEHKGKDVGLRMLYETLKFLKDYWNIVVLKWSALNDGIRDRLGRNLEETSADDIIAQSIDIKLARLFARIGFEQAGRNKDACSAWFMTSKTFPATLGDWKSREDIQKLDIFLPPKPHRIEGADKELEVLISDALKATSHEQYPSQIEHLVKNKGASIDDSRVLFILATNAPPNSTQSLETYVLNPLLRLGADVNVKDENGCTPMHCATVAANLHLIKALQDAGADPYALNDKGHTPLESLQERLQGMEDFRRAFGF